MSTHFLCGKTYSQSTSPLRLCFLMALDNLWAFFLRVCSRTMISEGFDGESISSVNVFPLGSSVLVSPSFLRTLTAFLQNPQNAWRNAFSSATCLYTQHCLYYILSGFFKKESILLQENNMLFQDVLTGKMRREQFETKKAINNRASCVSFSET